ncbi:Alpha/Beta hydrolase protein [Tribonema minus]|uniref:Alpha/Beta hydrolase protein n=1 Tax=Tribonema minus TaxID=303371 RepID=A0A835Z7B1_9STRA|nr:Alpha/Beta hydrolase protein [Tribonema minus]
MTSAARLASTTSAAAAATERSFQLPSGQVIAAKVWGHAAQGQDSRKRILALHGYLDNANTFDLLGPALAGEGYEVVAIDLPGHGLSSHTSSDNWYDIMDYPHSIAAVQDALGWDSCHYLGHSLGAGIASLVAGALPDRVTGCVFIDALGPFTLAPHGAHMHLRRAMQSRAALLNKQQKVHVRCAMQSRAALLNKQQKVWPSLELAVQARVAAAADYPGSQTISKEAAAILMQRSIEPVSPEHNNGKAGGVRFRYDLRLRAYSSTYLSEDTVSAFLSNIACPCLLVTGQTGFPLSGGFRARMQTLGPRLADHAHLPGSHHLHLDPESWQGVRDVTLKFLADLQESSDAAAAAAGADHAARSAL